MKKHISMKKFDGMRDNSKEFWNIQYAPQRREDYLKHVVTLSDTQRFDLLLRYVSDGDCFLDLACGFGLGAITVKRTYGKCEVWGCDQADVMVNDLAKDNPDITWKVSSIGDGSLPSNYFDVVFAGDVVEHLEDPHLLFKEAYRVLKPGGKLIITTPDGDVTPYLASPDHIWLMTHDDMDMLYKDNGFKEPAYPYMEGREGILVMFSVGTIIK